MNIEINPDFPPRIFQKTQLCTEEDAMYAYAALVEEARNSARIARHAWRKWKETPPTGPDQDAQIPRYWDARRRCMQKTRDAGTLRRLISKWWPR